LALSGCSSGGTCRTCLRLSMTNPGAKKQNHNFYKQLPPSSKTFKTSKL